LSPTNVGKCEQRVMLHTHTHTHTSHHIQLSEPTRDRVTSLAALVDAGEDNIKADGGRAGVVWVFNGIIVMLHREL